MIHGVIDIGSNTIRLNVYKIKEGRNFELLFSKKEAVGIVSYIKKKVMSEEGIEVLENCLIQFKEMMQSLHITSFSAFATASLRNIENTQEVLERVLKDCDIDIDLLSGATEGRLSFKGAIHGLAHDEGIYVDTGGGSSEIILYDHRQIGYVASMPIGSLNMYNKYVKAILPKAKEVNAMRDRVIKELKEAEKTKGSPADERVSGNAGPSSRNTGCRSRRRAWKYNKEQL